MLRYDIIMELVKSNWIADENHVRLSMPIAKIDRQNRLVSGFATLDNLDTGDDVVTAEASVEAFSNWRGNIREMHQPIAAGRLMNFVSDSFYDPNANNGAGGFYNGIFSTVYVSEGAEDTWKKVLDGTLSGFSIGGNIVESHTEYVPDLGKTVRFITKYDLVELSLVDNPANQLANIFSIVKSHGATMLKGIAAETKILNVFWCENEEIAKHSENESEICLSCGTQMEQIGFIEQGGDVAVKTATAVANFLRQKEDDAVTKQADKTANGEGGVQMSDEIKKNDDAGVVTSEDVNLEDEKVAEEETVEEAPAEDAKAEEAVEEAPAEPDFEKMFDTLKSEVVGQVEASKAAVTEAVESVEKRIAEVSEAFDTKASELEKALGELSEGLASVKDEREGVAKRLDALEKASAIKKSGEVETSPEKKVQKGLWSGAFLGDDE
jgi:hypothetical protein